MSITLTVDNTPFDYPETGDSNWGEGATEWAKAVTKVLASVSGPADILETSDIINNNQSTFLPIANFTFNSATTRSFAVRGNIYRSYGGSEVTEEFLLVGLYQGAAGWTFTKEGFGNAGVTFDITNTGEVRYKSTNLAGSPYSGIIKFRGVGILNT